MMTFVFVGDPNNDITTASWILYELQVLMTLYSTVRNAKINSLRASSMGPHSPQRIKQKLQKYME